MSDFDSLREDIAGIAESFAGYATAGKRFATHTATEIDKLWTDNAELRDDLLAVANRLENLTAFVTSNPAEVAAKIVTDANRATAAKMVETEPGKNVERILRLQKEIDDAD